MIRHSELRAERDAFGVERRRAGEHAEALAEQVQREAGARFLAHGDVAQHRFLVHLAVVDQAQAAETDGGVVAGRPPSTGCAADRGEAGFQPAMKRGTRSERLRRSVRSVCR